MADKPCVLISACLLGVACRYDGNAQPCGGLEALRQRAELIPACPEQLGGLPTPRTPAERRGAQVITRNGRDVTDAYQRGAAQAAHLARLFGARLALLKSRSPSCGSGEIYDGSFTGRRIPGRGVTAEALEEQGLRVFGEQELDQLLALLERGADD